MIINKRKDQGEATAYPVKYMVVQMEFLGFKIPFYKIIDTSFSGQGRTIEHFLKAKGAHLVCAIMNHQEGYKYPL